MKNFYVLIFSLIVNISLAQSTIRVTSGQNLQTLIDANPAETFYLVEPGIQNTNLDIGKKVTIIGTGYFLTQNNTASPGEVIVSHIRFKPGSDGSMITGLKTASININANNVIVQRCYVEGEGGRIRIGYTGLGNSGGYWNGTANNFMLLQNYAARLEWIARPENGVTNSSANNCVVKGNIFFRYGFHLEGNISGEISNNTFMPGIASNENYHSYEAGSSSCKILPIILRNNIMPRINQNYCQINALPTTDFNGNVFTQNFTNLTPSNTINANPDELFLGYPNNTNNLAPDARAKLAANSVAKTAGVGGTEAGAFGGDTPYVLSGIPTIPSIYQLTVPTQVPANGTLNIQIKAKTNN
jgi:hypothetical protein